MLIGIDGGDDDEYEDIELGVVGACGEFGIIELDELPSDRDNNVPAVTKGPTVFVCI